MRGRPPKPVELKRLAGNPGKRTLSRGTSATAAMVRAPKWLDDEAKREWRRVASELYRLQLLSRVDRAALAAYCQAWSRWTRAEMALAGEPLTLETDKGYVYPNPLIGVANSALEQMKRWATEFGMTPSSRGRIRMAEQEEVDPFEEWARRKLDQSDEARREREGVRWEQGGIQLTQEAVGDGLESGEGRIGKKETGETRDAERDGGEGR